MRLQLQRFSFLTSPAARIAALATVGLAALAAAGAAQAGSNVYWSVGVAAPGIQVGVASAPPVVAAAPVFVQPAPVWVQPAPVVVQPAPVWVQPAPVVYRAPRVVVPAPVVYRPVPRGWVRHHHPHGPRPVAWPSYGQGVAFQSASPQTGYGP
jgi:hypothetical protein